MQTRKRAHCARSVFPFFIKKQNKKKQQQQQQKNKNSSKKNVRVKINSLNVIDRIYPQVLEIINKQRNINGAPQKSALRYSISKSLYTIRKGFS